MQSHQGNQHDAGLWIWIWKQSILLAWSLAGPPQAGELSHTGPLLSMAPGTSWPERLATTPGRRIAQQCLMKQSGRQSWLSTEQLPLATFGQGTCRIGHLQSRPPTALLSLQLGPLLCPGREINLWAHPLITVALEQMAQPMAYPICTAKQVASHG